MAGKSFNLGRIGGYGSDWTRNWSGSATGPTRPRTSSSPTPRTAIWGFGLTAPGPRRGGGFKSRAEYLQNMRDMVASDLVDVMLMSVSSAEVLVGDGTLDGTPVTPGRAVERQYRHLVAAPRHLQGGSGAAVPHRRSGSRRGRFRSGPVRHHVLQRSGIRSCNAGILCRVPRGTGDTGLRHFLEVFNPAFDTAWPARIWRSTSTTASSAPWPAWHRPDRPLFLKAVYNGPRALEELAAYDPSGLIIGILGGGKGTTRDTFELVRQAEKYGGRVALFGRKINLAESPTTLVSLMRRVVEGEASSEEAVRAYHGELQSGTSSRRCRWSPTWKSPRRS